VEAYRRFEAEEPGALWQGDIVHGPQVLVGDKQTTAKIVTWIDDYSRFVLHIQAYDNERLPAIEDSLTQALLKYGKPWVLLVDNGQVYCSHSFTMACSQLGIRKRHTEPRRPEGKGKQERFYRTLRGQLLNEVENVQPIPIQRLNELLACWLSLYHATVHSKTKEKPADRFKRGTIRPVDRVVLEEAFLQWTERKVTKQGIIEFAGQEYFVDVSLVGLRLIVRYNPYDVSKIFLWREGKKIGSATPEELIYPSLARPPKPKEGQSAHAESYLQNLEQGYLSRLQSQVNQIQLPDGGSHE
jgi:transposase InsO family protein